MTTIMLVLLCTLLVVHGRFYLFLDLTALSFCTLRVAVVATFERMPKGTKRCSMFMFMFLLMPSDLSSTVRRTGRAHAPNVCFCSPAPPVTSTWSIYTCAPPPLLCSKRRYDGNDVGGTHDAPPLVRVSWSTSMTLGAFRFNKALQQNIEQPTPSSSATQYLSKNTVLEPCMLAEGGGSASARITPSASPLPP